MSGGITGPTGGAGRVDWEPADPAKTEALLRELQSIKGSGPKWLSILDSDSSTRKLAEKLLQHGTFDAADAKALVKDAKDFGKITFTERQVFAGLLRDHAEKMTPEAREALSKFMGLPLGRPQVVTTHKYSYAFDDDMGKKVTAFEAELAGLPQRQVTPQKKAELQQKWKGMAAVFNEDALRAMLAPLGLTPADFR